MKSEIDSKLLFDKIKSSGLKKKALADKMSLTPAGLRKKLNGESEFKVSEIIIIANSINLSHNEVFEIFFKNCVDLKSTKEH